MFHRAAVIAAALAVTMAAVAAQISPERERARPHYRAGEAFLRIEAWKEAAKSFQQAIDIDPQFEDAYYGLGRAQMAHEAVCRRNRRPIRSAATCIGRREADASPISRKPAATGRIA